MSLTANEVSAFLNGEIIGDGTIQLHGMAPADRARPGELTFAENPAYFAAAAQSQASAIIVSGDHAATDKVLIKVPNARIALARVLPLFFPPEQPPAGIHPSAAIHESAQIDPSAHIGPHCTVGPRVKIGARSVLMSGNDLGADCRIGEDTFLYPNVVLYRQTIVGNRVAIHAGTVIGSDGFGYVLDGAAHRKVLHLGNVIIGDDVEIGANTAIDRGALGPTRIGDGTKIDNLVHIAHNVQVGRCCLIMGQAGFAGSTKLGDYVVVASQSGVADHLTLGNQSVVGAKSGVMRDVADRERVLGTPAAPDRQAKRQLIAMQQLPDLLHRVRDLERELKELKGGSAAGESIRS